jgi:hypothetical protein
MMEKIGGWCGVWTRVRLWISSALRASILGRNCRLVPSGCAVHDGASETSEDDTSALAGSTPALAAVLRIFADL